MAPLQGVINNAMCLKFFLLLTIFRYILCLC